MAQASEAQRRRWSAEIDAWRASGKTLSAWSRERRLSRDTLEYWKRRLNARPTGKAPLKLIAVAGAAATVAPREAAPALELILERQGVRIVVPPNFDAASLSRLLDIVSPRC